MYWKKPSVERRRWLAASVNSSSGAVVINPGGNQQQIQRQTVHGHIAGGAAGKEADKFPQPAAATGFRNIPPQASTPFCAADHTGRTSCQTQPDYRYSTELPELDQHAGKGETHGGTIAGGGNAHRERAFRTAHSPAG